MEKSLVEWKDQKLEHIIRMDKKDSSTFVVVWSGLLYIFSYDTIEFASHGTRTWNNVDLDPIMIWMPVYRY